VQALSSLQSLCVRQQPETVAPLEQTPPEHTSPVVHGFPSSHGTLFGGFRQVPLAQTSSVQTFPSEQSASATQSTTLMDPTIPTSACMMQ
jgi:hypothetical protein